MPRKPRKVIRLPLTSGSVASEKYRKLAAELIKNHATPSARTSDKNMTTQHILGDGNIQLQGHIPVSQTITGNNNIQLALGGNEADVLLAKLSQLVMAQAGFSKKQKRHETL